MFPPPQQEQWELYSGALDCVQDHCAYTNGSFLPLKKASKQNNRASLHTSDPACYCPRHPKCLPGSNWFPKSTWHIKSTQRSLLHETTFSTTNERLYRDGWGAVIGLQVQWKFSCVLGAPLVYKPLFLHSIGRPLSRGSYLLQGCCNTFPDTLQGLIVAPEQRE